MELTGAEVALRESASEGEWVQRPGCPRLRALSTLSHKPFPYFFPTGSETGHRSSRRCSVNGGVGWMDWKYWGEASWGRPRCDSQEGVKGGLTISRNKKLRWRDEGARAHRGGVVLATACWSGGQLSKKLCSIHKKGRRRLIWKGCRTGTPYFDFGHLFWSC